MKLLLMNSKYWIIAFVLVLGFAVQSASAEQLPAWVKNNAGWWAGGKIGDDEFVKGIQYMVASEIITVSTLAEATDQNSSSATDAISQTSINTSSCDSMQSAADKETCIDNITQATELKSEIASATPYVVGPMTYYLVGTDALNTGDGVMITVHTILENTGSPSQNVDLYCTGPYACNYHLTDGQNDFPPSIYSLTSGHLELIYHDPHKIDWNFYTKSTLFGWTYDPSKQYSFKIDEPFGHGVIPLRYTLQ